jgi:methyl-accepting chemotaxis protein
LLEDTSIKMKTGTALVAGANEAFAQVTESASKATDLVAEIAAASEEQARGIDQVSTAVAEMDKVTQQNAAGAEESASSSAEMYSQAEELKEIVTKLTSLIGGSTDQKYGDQKKETLISEEKSEQFKSLKGDEFAEF